MTRCCGVGEQVEGKRKDQGKDLRQKREREEGEGIERVRARKNEKQTDESEVLRKERVLN